MVNDEGDQLHLNLVLTELARRGEELRAAAGGNGSSIGAGAGAATAGNGSTAAAPLRLTDATGGIRGQVSTWTACGTSNETLEAAVPYERQQQLHSEAQQHSLVNVTWRVLDRQRFANGWVYWDNGTEASRERAVLLHNNYIIGIDAKLERLEASGLQRFDQQRGCCISRLASCVYA